MPALDFSDLPDRPSRTPHKSLKWILGVCASITVVALSSTLASNINLNGGGNVEFGQGQMTATACAGNQNIYVTPSSEFTDGAFYLKSITISNIPASCYGRRFQVVAYPASGSNPLALSNDSSVAAVFEDSDGTFTRDIRSSWLTVTTNSTSSVTLTFVHPGALSSSLYKIRVDSTNPRSYHLGDTGPGGGIVFYVADSPSGFNEVGTTCSPACHYLEWAPINWAAEDYKSRAFSDNINFYGGGTETAIGTGFTNTSILASPNESTGWTVASDEVAPFVRAYRGGGFADWFIPSRDEMYLISNSTQFSHGGFNQDSYYWSSTANSEGPGTGVQLHFMNNSDGTQDPGLQPVYRNFPLRPIRAF